jgi:ribosomal protein L12E/L44/L45/RPP1/RPP2
MQNKQGASAAAAAAAAAEEEEEEEEEEEGTEGMKSSIKDLVTTITASQQPRQLVIAAQPFGA